MNLSEQGCLGFRQVEIGSENYESSTRKNMVGKAR